MHKTFEEIFSEIVYLLNGYSSQYRTTVQPFRFRSRAKQIGFSFDPTDETVRKSLLEHVGMLPVLASYFHEHVLEPVNLEKSLEMLAIHDIGELIVGDESVFTKAESAQTCETEAALKLLSKQQQLVYLEFEALETNDAKFARSIDKIGPDIFDALCEHEVTFKRLKHFARLEPRFLLRRNLGKLLQ